MIDFVAVNARKMLCLIGLTRIGHLLILSNTPDGMGKECWYYFPQDFTVLSSETCAELGNKLIELNKELKS